MTDTYSDPDILTPFFGPGGGVNFSFAPKNAELEDLLKAQRLEFDPEKRKEIIFKAQDLLVDQAWWAPLYEPKYLVASRKVVKGITIDPLGFTHLQELSV